MDLPNLERGRGMLETMQDVVHHCVCIFYGFEHVLIPRVVAVNLEWRSKLSNEIVLELNVIDITLRDLAILSISFLPLTLTPSPFPSYSSDY